MKRLEIERKLGLLSTLRLRLPVPVPTPSLSGSGSEFCHVRLYIVQYRAKI
jgi:hypothetical protein